MRRSAAVEAALQGIQRSNHPVELRELIDGATDEALQFRPGPADWSVVDIVRHLGDVEEMRHMRLDRILAEDNPLMERATLQPGERDRDDAKVLLQRWERLRTRALERLSAMSDEQWRRIGTQAPDPHVGRVTPFVTDVLDQAVRINEHSGDHLGHIWKNLAMFRLRRSRKRVRRRLVDVWGTCPLERTLRSRRGRRLCYRISESWEFCVASDGSAAHDGSFDGVGGAIWGAALDSSQGLTRAHRPPFPRLSAESRTCSHPRGVLRRRSPRRRPGGWLCCIRCDPARWHRGFRPAVAPAPRRRCAYRAAGRSDRPSRGVRKVSALPLRTRGPSSSRQRTTHSLSVDASMRILAGGRGPNISTRRWRSVRMRRSINSPSSVMIAI